MHGSRHLAQVAELVDALASGASIRKDVEVRVLSWAPHYYNKCNIFNSLEFSLENLSTPTTTFVKFLLPQQVG